MPVTPESLVKYNVIVNMSLIVEAVFQLDQCGDALTEQQEALDEALTTLREIDDPDDEKDHSELDGGDLSDDHWAENEIYEYWSVDKWLAGKLQGHGEVVMNDFYGHDIWGRQCTGQSIHMDCVFAKIATELNEAYPDA